MKQTALITGASKRIGRSLTEHLAEKGWNVVVHYNSSAKGADELVKELSDKYPNQQFSAVQANLAHPDEVVGLIPQLAANNIIVDLLVNNASVFDRGYLKGTSLELFNSQMDVNLKAPFFLIRDFSNYFKTGNIINFVDTRVTVNASNFAAYSISKKGLWDLTKMAALELAPDIRVNAIAPGVTLPPEDEDENYLEKLAQGIPMKKPGGVDPILKSLDYILENDHLTGQLLFADGGENLGKNL
ncbi:SDR family NAD(P)-dependent oxidoreductase [uncultured Draconibacterium sp.]|uniref:SDR family NAD(P)-dependent oxidoreductase n=1 Tax=uncultured Draconibacterium sp. TaxID=1573823 RepID=UPI0025D35D26|nr:SDR family NAD(P)-dependent oxidoreductase [uncultured Draconibacterium sp.]